MLIPATEFSDDFTTKMRNRMAVSYHKYGPIAKAYPHKVNAIKSLKERLKKYEETGNAEWLIDVANFCMIEFMLPAHENAHFEAKDSNESPGRVWYDNRSKIRTNDGERA